ncbi:efflux RND transporter permease subunit [Albimonas sp. CAU 1670]|uniref:efflux RND transporter permease subunit n=1 Tax=Albimonas sp. CAU 1670 TaxID=3032599 RepID=UPI0023DCE7E5|nr:efflux RND transporter permease subunit [Albimonas sp. CAU 1670]MDF2233314.1 efflux RND transporter permease subunit [Albimonas sp. CAU 1670]
MRRAPGFFGYFVRHGTAANLLLLAMIIAGLGAVQNLRTQFMPDIVANDVYVNVKWPGAGPEQVDRNVVQVLQPALAVVEGVDEISAKAREGSAAITLTFEPGYDIFAAAESVSAAVSSVGPLPEGAESPTVERHAWTFPVTDVVFHGPVDPDLLVRLADEYAERLRVEGLSRISVRGAPDRRIRIEASEPLLLRHDATLAEIASAVSAAAASSPGGATPGGARISTGEETRSREDLGDVVVRTTAEGEKLRVRDLAQVVDDGDRRGARFYVKGEPAALVRVSRGETGDTLRQFAVVQRVAEEMRPSLPAGVEIAYFNTFADRIAQRLSLLLDNALFGLLLVVGVLFLFLNARTALWVAAGIPTALLAAAAAMWALGVSINMVSLFGLILTLGMVVDDAIVVGEHADHLARRRGLSPIAAAETAARRMAAPVFSSAVTTLLAFSGMLALGGRFGKMVEDIPTVVCIVLAASLAECFLVLPNHMRHAIEGMGRRRWYDRPAEWVNRGFDRFVAVLFRPAVVWMMRLRYPLMGLAVMLLLLSVERLVSGELQWRFWNAPERGQISANIAMLAGAEREDTLAQLALVDQALEETAAEFEAKYGTNPIRFALSRIGGAAGRGLSVQDEKEPWQLASVEAELIDADLRPYSSSDFNAAVQARVQRHPMAEIIAFRFVRSGPGGDAVSVELTGADPAVLKHASEDIQAALSAYPEVSALEDSLAYDKTELVLTLTPLGEALGFTTDALGAELRRRLTGVTAAEFAVDGREASIVVALARDELTADFLSRSRVRTPSGDWAPISELVEVTARPGFSLIRRVDGVVSVTVSGDIDQSDAARAQEIEDDLRDRILPAAAERHDVRWSLSGLAEQEKRFLAEAEYGFAAAMIGIYLTLAWVFGSWTRPLAVIAVVPFGLIGVVWGHLWMGLPLTLFSVVGMIGMSGIIINDSIVLVSTADEYARNRALRPAVIDAVCDRLRPVMLTTLTTVVGLAPLLTETSKEAQFLKPTVVSLCFGLGAGFFLVLLVTPALITLQRDVRAALVSTRRMARLALDAASGRPRRRGLGGARRPV